MGLTLLCGFLAIIGVGDFAGWFVYWCGDFWFCGFVWCLRWVCCLLVYLFLIVWFVLNCFWFCACVGLLLVLGFCVLLGCLGDTFRFGLFIVILSGWDCACVLLYLRVWLLCYVVLLAGLVFSGCLFWGFWVNVLVVCAFFTVFTCGSLGG